MGENKGIRHRWAVIVGLIVGIVASASAAPAAAQASAAQTPPPEPFKQYAIVIGVGQTKHAPWALDNADDDARRFVSEVLLDTSYGFDEGAIRLLVSRRTAQEQKPGYNVGVSTREGILAALDELVATGPNRRVRLAPDASVIVYFVGHGLSTRGLTGADGRPVGSPFALAAADAAGPTSTEGLVFSQEIRDRLTRLNVGLIWSIYDMCRPGASADGDPGLREAFVPGASSRPGRKVVTMYGTDSSFGHVVDVEDRRLGQMGEDAPKIRTALFSHYLRMALRKTAPRAQFLAMIPALTEDGAVNASSVMPLVEGWMRDYTEANNLPQRPVLVASTGDGSNVAPLLRVQLGNQRFDEQFTLWRDPRREVRDTIRDADDALRLDIYDRIDIQLGRLITKAQDLRPEFDPGNTLYGELLAKAVQLAEHPRVQDRSRVVEAYRTWLNRQPASTQAYRGFATAVYEWLKDPPPADGSKTVRAERLDLLARALERLAEVRAIDPTEDGPAAVADAIAEARLLNLRADLLEQSEENPGPADRTAIRLAVDRGLAIDPDNLELRSLRAQAILGGDFGLLDLRSPLLRQAREDFDVSIQGRRARRESEIRRRGEMSESDRLNDRRRWQRLLEDDLETLYQAALLEDRANNAGRLVELLQEAIGLPMEEPRLQSRHRLFLARHWIEAQDDARADRMLDEAIGIDAYHSPSRMVRGMRRMDRQDFAGAAEDFSYIGYASRDRGFVQSPDGRILQGWAKLRAAAPGAGAGTLSPTAVQELAFLTEEADFAAIAGDGLRARIGRDALAAAQGNVNLLIRLSAKWITFEQEVLAIDPESPTHRNGVRNAILEVARAWHVVFQRRNLLLDSRFAEALSQLDAWLNDAIRSVDAEPQPSAEARAQAVELATARWAFARDTQNPAGRRLRQDLVAIAAKHNLRINESWPAAPGTNPGGIR